MKMLTRDAWRRHPLLSKLAEAAKQSLALDLRSLALFRISISIVLLLDLAGRFPDVVALYSNAGVLPLSATRIDRGVWGHIISFHALNGSPEFQYFLFGLAALFAFCLLIGWRSQLFTFLSWLMVCSLQNRNPFVLQSGDTLLHLMLFWLIFVPADRFFAIDAGKYKENPLSIASVHTAGLILQVLFIYLFSLPWKLRGACWRDGTAVYYALSLDWYTSALGALLNRHFFTMKILTYLTLAIEFFAPLLILSPWRTALCRFAGIFLLGGLQVSFFLLMDLGMFPIICLGALPLLLPSAFWDWVGRRKTAARPQAYAGGGKIESAFIGTMVAFMILQSLNSILNKKYRFIPQRALNAAHVAGFNQLWYMFSPTPKLNDGWFLLSAKLRNGDEVDLFATDSKFTLEKPKGMPDFTRRFRWKEYILKSTNAWSPHRNAPLCRYFKERWDRAHGPEKMVQEITLYYMLEKTPPPGQAPKITQQTLFRARYSPDGESLPFHAPR